MRKTVMLLVLIVGLLLGTGTAETLLLTSPAEIVPGGENVLTVEAPCPGSLTLWVQDDAGDELPVVDALAVGSGRTEIPWDGRSYGGMPLQQGFGTITAELRGEGGAVLRDSREICVVRGAATLTYALPSCERLYLRDKASWFVDCAVTGKSVVCLEIWAEAQPETVLASVRKGLDNGGLFRLNWNGKKKNGKRLAAGTYAARVYVEGQEEQAVRFSVEICDGKTPEGDVVPTGPLLPETTDDAAIRAALLSPLTVVDIDSTAHQAIYAEADKSSAVLGTVHGQTQGLEVLSVGSKWVKVHTWRHEDGAEIIGFVPKKSLKVVTPNSRWGIVIDKQAQTLTVYDGGEVVGQARVSTGLMAQGKRFRETRAGAFLVSDRLPSYRSGGFLFLYPIRIDGGNLLHQVGVDSSGSLGAQTAQLGQKASEGCVRVDWRTDADHTVNAWYLWTHIPRGTKVLVLDDPAAREARMAELGGA